MTNRLPALIALRAFEASARLGSHRKAAAELHLDHTVVSKHVRNLEAELGVRLLAATPTGTRLTAVGEEYYREIALALDTIAVATEKLRSPGPHPTLHIACSPGLGMRWLAPRLGRFLEACQGLEVTLRPTSRAPNLLDGEADVDIRSTDAREVPGTKQLELCRPRMYPVASPQFLALQPPVRQPADLLALPLCHEETHQYWRLWLRAAGVTLAKAPTGPRYWSAALAIDAAKLGQGVAIANDFIAAEELASGSLVEVLSTDIHVYPYVLRTRQAAWNDPIVTRFREWLVGQLLPQPAHKLTYLP